MKKNIMILGAGRGQVGLIQAVKRYGHTAVVASISGDYPGLKIADKVCDVDITDPRQVARAAKAQNIDGIVTCCMDTGMEALGFVCDQYHLSGLSLEAAEVSRDKLKMKEKMRDYGVQTPKFLKASEIKDLDIASKTLRFPVIVKAVDQQGSKGLYIAESIENLRGAFDNSISETKKPYCIIEEFISGQKHGANGCIYGGNLIFLLPTKDITDGIATLGHIVPFWIEEDTRMELERQVKTALHAIGLDNCVFNVDFIMQDGKIQIIEITGRMGANGLPELISMYYGIDIYKMLIDISLGIDPTEYFQQNCSTKTSVCSYMLSSPKDGILKEIKTNGLEDKKNVAFSFFVSKGDPVFRYRSAKDCVGQIVVQGESAEACLMQIEEAQKMLDIVLEEEYESVMGASIIKS